MNASAYPVTSGLDAYSKPPILIAASSERAARRAAETADAAGLPYFSIPIEAVLARLDSQGRATAFWLELEDDGDDGLDQLLTRLDAEVGAGRFPAVIATPNRLIDPVSARIRHADIEIVVDGTPADRVAALTLAIWRRDHQN